MLLLIRCFYLGFFVFVVTTTDLSLLARFCPAHSTTLAPSSRQSFVLHRDILHALLLPLLQIRSQAASIASQTLSAQLETRNARSPPPQPSTASPTTSLSFEFVDLELAFRGEARGAFSWLQCFMAEERDWCSTEGCPACVVLKVLHSEPFIRIVVASCLLSRYLRDMLQGQNSGDGFEKKFGHEFATTSSALPEFDDFWLSAVHQAVSEDDFWGLHFWEDIEARAKYLEGGVKDLIHQCCKVDGGPRLMKSMTMAAAGEAAAQPTRAVSLVSSIPSLEPSPSPAPQSQATTQPPLLTPQQRLEKVHEQEQKQKKGEGEEETRWMSKIIDACWLALMREAAFNGRRNDDHHSPPFAKSLVGTDGLRVRSLTT